jgi:hypothetical protein
LVLGAALTRELTRHKQEPLGLGAGLSIVFYGIIQIPYAWKGLAPYLLVFGLNLKVLCGVAIGGFWVMVGEIARASTERPTVEAFKSRFRAEIHDASGRLDVIPKLTEVVRSVLDGSRIEEAKGRLEEIDKVAVRLNLNLQRILPRLQGADELLRQGLVPALSKLRDELQDDTNGVIKFEATPTRSGLDEDRKEWFHYDDEKERFYSVAREALLNAVRHAKSPTLIRMTLDCERRCLLVEDDGDPGFCEEEATQKDGHGIKMMRAWAAQVGAHLSVERRQPHGTRVKLEVASEPWEPPARGPLKDFLHRLLGRIGRLLGLTTRGGGE